MIDKYNNAYKMALELANNYTFDSYCKLIEYCIDNDIFYCDGNDNDFYIEDEHYKYKD